MRNTQNNRELEMSVESIIIPNAKTFSNYIQPSQLTFCIHKLHLIPSLIGILTLYLFIRLSFRDSVKYESGNFLNALFQFNESNLSSRPTKRTTLFMTMENNFFFPFWFKSLGIHDDLRHHLCDLIFDSEVKWIELQNKIEKEHLKSLPRKISVL